MTIDLTHVGEEITACMANNLRMEFFDVCRLQDLIESQHLTMVEGPLAHAEVSLCPYKDPSSDKVLSFDGKSRVDTVVLIRPDLGLPFELKLGTTGLNKGRVDKWLAGRGDYTHGGNRIGGSMMSILERNFPGGSDRSDLRVRLEDGREVHLTEDWVIVARSETIDRWEANRPAFSNRVRFVKFERIVEQFGSERFNEEVRELVCFDYHDEWITGTWSA